MPFFNRSSKFERDMVAAMRAVAVSVRDVANRLGRIEDVVQLQTEAFMALPQELQDLESAVAANTDQGQSAKIAMEKLAALIVANAQAATDLADARAKAAALAQTIRGNSETLANAILRTDGDPTNDPAPPPDQGGGPFNPSQQG